MAQIPDALSYDTSKDYGTTDNRTMGPERRKD